MGKKKKGEGMTSGNGDNGRRFIERPKKVLFQ